MDSKLTALEILGIAVKSEEKAAEYYTKLSNKIKNDLVKARYQTLADEEKRHRKIVVGLYRKLSGEKFDPPQVRGDIKVAEGGLPPIDMDNFEDALKHAIAMEEQALKFYSDAALSSDNQSARKVLEYLADQERGHAQVLKVELDSYLKDKHWYADNPDIQLVGP